MNINNLYLKYINYVVIKEKNISSFKCFTC